MTPGAPHAGESPSSPDQDLPPLSIVALDDDADFRQYIRAVLEPSGHDVRTAATPDEFFSACEAHLPDVVLLDIKMGRHNGEAVLQEIRRRWPRQCVVVVTGYPSLDSMRQTFKQDAFDYLAKPFSLQELNKTLGQAVASLGLGRRPQDRLRQELGRQIRLARTEKGWTLKDLSEACGISVSQLSSIERGSHLPSLESLLAVASALDRLPSAWLAAAGF
ncbi:MAG: response regulator [Phycisphaeraceae bacterium]|nr:response regulator [Phycisphaeraceae bacterium]